MANFQRQTRKSWKPQKLNSNLFGIPILIILLFVSCTYKTSFNRRLLSENTSWTCKWDPDNINECDQMLSDRLPPPTKYKLKDDQEVERRRFLLFGDSTMGRLFVFSPLRMILQAEVGQGECPIKDITCSEIAEISDHRCSMHVTFGLDRTQEWIRPDHTRHEGPAAYGLINPYCKDCGGCVTLFPDCLHNPVADDHSGSQVESEGINCTKKMQVYGGYFSMNFARDVELQTPEFLTTQENYVAYINRKWNTPELIRDWGKPICIMSAGIHDMIIRFNKMKRGDDDIEHKYKENIRWLLATFQPECKHIIWLGNTANGHEKNNTMFPILEYKIQTMENMKKIDTDVKDVIMENPEFSSMVSFIDVHHASLFRPHDDFIHMGPKWYGQLGVWLSSFM